MIDTPRKMTPAGKKLWETPKYQAIAKGYENEFTKLLSLASLAETSIELVAVNKQVAKENTVMLNEQGNLNALIKHRQSLRKEVEAIVKRLDKITTGTDTEVNKYDI